MTTPKKDLCVTFDLWETLILDRPELDVRRNRMRSEGIYKLLASSGIGISLEEFTKGYDQTASQLQAIWRVNKELSTTDQVRLILKSAGLPDLAFDSEVSRKLENAYVEPLFNAPPVLNPDAIATLMEVRERVGKVGLISNTGRSPGVVVRKLLAKLGIGEFFDSTVFSDEVGLRKPEKCIFETAARELETDLANIVHIGDDPEGDVWGAKQAGMRAILFDYPVPEGFRKQRTSLFALSRSDRRIPDSEIRPDGRIKSLSEAPAFLDSLI